MAIQMPAQSYRNIEWRKTTENSRYELYCDAHDVDESNRKQRVHLFISMCFFLVFLFRRPEPMD